MVISTDDVREALKKVIDPELGINIVDLGLVYDIRIDQGEVEVELTLTSPGCPLAGVLDKMVKDAVGSVPGVTKVYIDLVWDPPWTMDLMSEEAKAELGFD